jgi:alginate O-acetyltransferase complex protein AlgI
VLAEKMGFWADQTFGIIQVGGAPTLIEAWIGMACFTFQIYFDFSGYSDMAIGLARMFGIRLPLNFDSPYKASNIVDFWRRWHMTLSRFLRDYLYFPLGGNRKGKLRRYGNLMTVMALGGLWHGAGWTFVLWGVVHGFYLIVNHAWWALAGHGDEHAGRRLHMARRWGGRLLTFVAVAFSWVLFRAESLADAMVMYRGLFGLNGIVLPTHYEPMLSSIGGLLAGIGVTFGAIPAYGGGWQLIWVFAMLLLVWLLPSTQELMHRFAPALDFGAARRPRLLGFALPAWRPSLLLGVITGIVMLALTIKLLQGQPGEFIYFQF